MRFMPLVRRAKNIIDSGAIGDVRLFTADFGLPTGLNSNGHRFDPQLGAGALLDRGVYPLSLAFQLLGSPSRLTSQVFVGPTGVDEHAAILLGYPEGQLAILSASLGAYSSNEAMIMGTRGRLRIHEPFYRPHKLTITQFPESKAWRSDSSSSKRRLRAYAKSIPRVQRLYLRFESYLSPLIRDRGRRVVEPFEGNGYNYEAAAVMRCLRAGELESKVMPLDETASIIETMDTIRREWHLEYQERRGAREAGES